MEAVRIGDEDNEFFAVQSGYPSSFHWPNSTRLVADHVAAGSFKTAALLLKEQLGIIRLKPFKSVFLHAYARYCLVYLFINIINS
jgi:coatomer protein complex subunit alpha (xenin)